MPSLRCTSFRELGCIVSHRKTFVNAENTTDSSMVFSTFLYRIDNYSASMTLLQAARTLLITGTQVWLP